MSRQAGTATSSHRVAPTVGAEPSIDRLRSALGMVSAQDISRLPFVGADATGGAEAELQASVQGSRATVDLPLAVSDSDFLANILRRAAVGDTAPRQVHALERFLDANSDQVWDNSWVRFPRLLLGPSAADVFMGDLRADKADGSNRRRGDAEKFLAVERGIEYARIPISYLLKLALADAVAALPERPEAVRKTGRRLLGIRLDSGDLAYLSIEARRILDEAGLSHAAIVASNDLDEHLIALHARHFARATQQQRDAINLALHHFAIEQRGLPHEAGADADLRQHLHGVK